jgi:hypothetical protein
MIRLVFSSLALLGAIGCAAPAAQHNLPRADEERWQRCLKPLRQANGCNTSDDVEAGLGAMWVDKRCLDKKAPQTEYARTPEAARPKWLLDHGCPEATVTSPR